MNLLDLRALRLRFRANYVGLGTNLIPKKLGLITHLISKQLALSPRHFRPAVGKADCPPGIPDGPSPLSRLPEFAQRVPPSCTMQKQRIRKPDAAAQSFHAGIRRSAQAQ